MIGLGTHSTLDFGLEIAEFLLALALLFVYNRCSGFVSNSFSVREVNPSLDDHSGRIFQCACVCARARACVRVCVCVIR